MKKDISKMVNDFFMRHRKKCWDRIKKEIPKHSDENNAVNRIICIIREENRKCNKDAEKFNIPLKKDALITIIKKDVLSSDIKGFFKSAARYL